MFLKNTYYFYLLLLIIGFSSCSAKKDQTTNQVCFNTRCIDVELARKPDELIKGLQFRDSLGKNEGMLFIFNESRRHSFWMKDTLIPLDMIWMDYSRRVVHIERNVPLCKNEVCPTYKSKEKAMYVLEVNGDYAKELGIHLGDLADFKLLMEDI